MDTRIICRTRASQVAIALIVSACAVSVFSPQALDFGVQIKTEALALMDEATNDFASHAGAVSQLRQRMDAALTLASGRSNNAESTRQWELMNDPNGNLLGGFLSRWEQRGPLSRAFIDGRKEQVSLGLDDIVDTENAKREE